MYKFDGKCFYPYSLRGDYEASGTWPTKGTDVDEETWQKFICQPPEGCTLSADDDGMPYWGLLPPPTEEELAATVRAKRDGLLISDIDSISPVRWNSMVAGKQSEWSKYRQDLLDVPKQDGFPYEVEWPTKPPL